MKALTHSAGQPERVREKTPRKATIDNTQITLNRVEMGRGRRSRKGVSPLLFSDQKNNFIERGAHACRALFRFRAIVCQ